MGILLIDTLGRYNLFYNDFVLLAILWDVLLYNPNIGVPKDILNINGASLA